MSKNDPIHSFYSSCFSHFSLADSFCDSRSTEGTGDYRNPWDCHHYLTCAPGKPKVYDRKCDNGTKEYLVYDPKMDMCNFPYFVECKQLPSE